MGYHVVAEAVAAFHYAFLAYVIGGGYLAWRWRWAIWPHLVACGWALAIVTFPTLVCPLTRLENWARHRAGLAVYSSGFINHYVEGVLYPARFTPLVQVLVALAVLVSWIGLLLRRRRSTTAAPGET